MKNKTLTERERTNYKIHKIIYHEILKPSEYPLLMTEILSRYAKLRMNAKTDDTCEWLLEDEYPPVESVQSMSAHIRMMMSEGSIVRVTKNYRTFFKIS